MLPESFMESKAKLLGHPIHPMLVVLPLGLLVGAVGFDAVYLWTGSPTFATVGYWNMAAGSLGGLIAAMFGVADWFAIPNNTRAKRVGLLHGGINLVVIEIFGFAWLERRVSGNLTPSGYLFGIEVAALVLAGIAAWLGGELVDRLGVGVDDAANLNAPRSPFLRAVWKSSPMERADEGWKRSSVGRQR